jgi:hypothetical protein
VGFLAAKRFALLIVLALGLVAPAAAQADTPPHTDVLFVFDTTGSMGDAIQEAQDEVQQSMAQISASLPDVQYGLASMADYGSSFINYNGQPEISPYDDENTTDIPWTLHQAITPNQAAISSELLKLSADGGGDLPEAYGRALYESTSNPAVGWRPGARGIIVLIADDVPHDDELNLGIPQALWVRSPFNTGIDPGADNTLGTGDDLDWQAVLHKLATDGRPLEYVDFRGEEEYLPYWQSWAGSTGGIVISAKGENDLGSKLVEAVKSGASLPACPSGQVRNSTLVCVPIPPPPSNNFKIEPRISCAKGCYVVEVKIVFDSNGYVISESVLNEEAARGGSSAGISAAKKGHKPKPKAQIKRLGQAVTPGVNTLKLKLTGTAKKELKKKGSLKLKVKISFTPTGGSTKSQVHTFNVKAPAKPAKKHRAPK